MNNNNNKSFQSKERLLSIILPIKDNHRMTKRWLDYAVKENFKFKIRIADGSSKQFLGINNYKKKLNIDYTYYGLDDNHFKYINKIYKELKKTKTPYSLFADNDDFYIKSTILKSIFFLENNKVYSSCGGSIFKFIISEKFKGKITYTTFSKQNSYEDDSPVKRLNKITDNFNEIFYDVVRTNDLLVYSKKFLELNKKKFNYFFYPLCLSFYLVSIGKVKKFDETILLRQEDYQSSTSSGIISSKTIFFDENFSFNLSNSLYLIQGIKKINVKFDDIKLMVSKTLINLIGSNITNDRNTKITLFNFIKSKISNNYLFNILKKFKNYIKTKLIFFKYNKYIKNFINKV